MARIAREVFPKATKVTDRFHVHWYNTIENSNFSKAFRTVARALKTIIEYL